MRVPPRLSRLCATSESRPGRADRSTCRPAARPIRHTKQGQSQSARGVGGGHGPLEQMEAAGFTAAFPLIQAHRPAKTDVKGQKQEWTCQKHWHQCEVKLTLSPGAPFFRLYPDEHL